MLEQYGVEWRGTRPIARLRDVHHMMGDVQRALEASPEGIEVDGLPELGEQVRLVGEQLLPELGAP